MRAPSLHPSTAAGTRCPPALAGRGRRARCALRRAVRLCSTHYDAGTVASARCGAWCGRGRHLPRAGIQACPACRTSAPRAIATDEVQARFESLEAQELERQCAPCSNLPHLHQGFAAPGGSARMLCRARGHASACRLTAHERQSCSGHTAWHDGTAPPILLQCSTAARQR